MPLRVCHSTGKKKKGHKRKKIKVNLVSVLWPSTYKRVWTFIINLNILISKVAIRGAQKYICLSELYAWKCERSICWIVVTERTRRCTQKEKNNDSNESACLAIGHLWFHKHYVIRNVEVFLYIWKCSLSRLLASPLYQDNCMMALHHRFNKSTLILCVF